MSFLSSTGIPLGHQLTLHCRVSIREILNQITAMDHSDTLFLILLCFFWCLLCVCGRLVVFCMILFLFSLKYTPSSFRCLLTDFYLCKACSIEDQSDILTSLLIHTHGWCGRVRAITRTRAHTHRDNNNNNNNQDLPPKSRKKKVWPGRRASSSSSSSLYGFVHREAWPLIT